MPISSQESFGRFSVEYEAERVVGLVLARRGVGLLRVTKLRPLESVSDTCPFARARQHPLRGFDRGRSVLARQSDRDSEVVRLGRVAAGLRLGLLDAIPDEVQVQIDRREKLDFERDLRVAVRLIDIRGNHLDLILEEQIDSGVELGIDQRIEDDRSVLGRLAVAGCSRIVPRVLKTITESRLPLQLGSPDQVVADPGRGREPIGEFWNSSLKTSNTAGVRKKSCVTK